MKTTPCLRAIVVASAVGVIGISAPAVRADGRATAAVAERTPGDVDQHEFIRAQATLHGSLAAAEVPGGADRPLTVSLSADEAAEISGPVSGGGPLKAGVTKRVETVVDFTDLTSQTVPSAAQARGLGAVRGGRRGGYVWSGAVQSSGAAALRLRFTNFSLPDGAELYLYNETGQVRGPYGDTGPSGTGEFWAHTVNGPVTLLQLRVPGDGAGRPRGPATFDIDTVGHLGPRFAPGATTAEPAAGSDLCGFNAPCIRNASCASLPAAIAPARDAVALIEYVSRPFIYLCSGGLIADTDAATQIPYFLTANHCIRREREANTVEAFFRFSTPCGGACYDPDGAVPSVLGSDVMATDSATDFTLLRLNQAPPAGSVFLGWSSSPVAFSNGTGLFRISHPAGAPQAYSAHVVDTGRPTCQSWPRGDRIYSSDSFGGTEGGSSGSPVLNAVGQIVGQLSGACGFNVGDACDAVSNATVDGAFAAYFGQVASILNPPAGSTTTTTVSSTTTSTAPASTTTTTLPGTCGGSGDSCSTGTECCSGTCRGRPEDRTCK